MKRNQRVAQEQAANEVLECACGLAPIKARTANQKLYLRVISTRDIVFGFGPAGTGKTYLAVAAACEALVAKKINRIIISRPAVEAAGEHLGFLPGELKEKFAPYFRPIMDIIYDRMGRTHAEYSLRNSEIEAIPLAYMRGTTFDDAWVILDEAQNTTPEQMEMFLTRIGENAKILINGCVEQSDITGTSGLIDGYETIRELARVGAVNFTVDDVVRSSTCADIVRAYAAKLNT